MTHFGDLTDAAEPIDLKDVPPFNLGELHVSPRTLEIVSPKGRQSLEPKVMTVLVALVRARGEVLTRDDLISACWSGRAISDDALHRAVGRLRRHLAHAPEIRIETLSRIGYRLVYESATAQSAIRGVTPDRVTAPAMTEGPKPAWQTLWSARPRLVVGLTAGLLVLAGGLIATSLAPAPVLRVKQLQSIGPVGAYATSPAVSADGQWLVSSESASRPVPRDLVLHSLKGHTAPRVLTRTPDQDELSPVFSPDGTRVAFVRRVSNQPCAIQILTLKDGTEQPGGRCQTNASTRLSWLNNHTLLFSDRSRGNEKSRIYALDLRSGTTRAVTAPPAESRADSEPLAHPDGEQFVFRRFTAHGVADLYISDLRGQIRQLTQDGWKSISYVWLNGGRTLAYSTTRGGDFGLWTFDLRTGEHRQISPGLRDFSRLGTDGQSLLVAEVDMTRSEFVRLAPQTLEAQPIDALPLRGYMWDMDIRSDGYRVFNWERDGGSTLWIMAPEAGAPPKPLFKSRTGVTSGAKWSPNGQSIAFMGVMNLQGRVQLIRPDGSGHQILSRAGFDPAILNWSADGRMLYVAGRDAEGWHVRMYDPMRPDSVGVKRQGTAGWTHVVVD
ncbi:MAG: winged helix-turn-helix domain-containing protein, partial [Asticcacaulis sp.]